MTSSPSTPIAVASRETLLGCRSCGLAQLVPTSLAPQTVAKCTRCGKTLRQAGHPRSGARAAAFSLAALLLYPPAMMLPVIEVQKMGNVREATIWSGVVQMLSDGQILVGIVVFLCSIVIPLLKIVGMFFVSTRGFPTHHRIATYRFIDWIGKWGMVDVLLVAVLIAVVKLGNLMQIHPGPGIAAFAGVVVCSLLASALFDPAAIWEERP